MEHAWTGNNSAVYNHLNDFTGVQHLVDITSLHSSLFTSLSPPQHCHKFDLRTARINLMQDNGLKAFKEMRLFRIHGNVNT